MKQSAIVFVLGLAALGTGACVDPSITVLDGGGHTREPPPTPDDDGGGDAPPVDPLAVCKSCLDAMEDPGPGCHTTHTNCINDKKCNDTLECIYEAGCFAGSPKSFLGCGTPCGTKAGIFTGNDPSLSIAAALFQCVANGACNPSCFASATTSP